MKWPDEMVNELKGMVEQGMTPAECARCLNVSRNAVIGKAHRLGLHRMTRPLKPEATRPPHLTHKRKPDHQLMIEPAPKAEPIVEIVDTDIPADQRVDLFGLHNFTCRWPCGTPGAANFFFCGHPSADMALGIPYCAVHAARARAGRTLATAEKVL